MEKSSYTKRVLYVNLRSGQTKKELLADHLLETFVGGFGMNLRLAYEHIVPGIDPLSSENVIILGAGVLAGTIAPGSSRLVATTKFPQNNCIGCCNGSMSFAAWMKYAGYDHIVIEDKAKKPVYLYIDDDDVRLLDATDLWGRDIYQVSDILWHRHSHRSGVIAIGKAGENLLPISLALVDKLASLGKGGLAAVMGSKNLKAIMIKGSKGVNLANGTRFMKLISEFHRRIRNDPLHDKWVDQGLMMLWPDILRIGSPCRNWEEVYPRDIEDKIIGLETYLKKVKKTRIACPSCPYADKEIMQAREGKFKHLTLYASSWTMGNVNFGIQCMAGDYDQVMKIFEMVQRFGLSRHAVGHIVDYAAHLYEKGIINKQDTDGMELRRDFKTTEILINLMVSREGIGEVMGKGLKAFATKFGPDSSREIMVSKGLEITLDPRIRGLSPTEFEFIVDPKGDHSECGLPFKYASSDPFDKFIKGCERIGISVEEMKKISKSQDDINIGRLTRYTEDWVSILNCLGLCSRTPYVGFYSLDDLVVLLSSATGLDLNGKELLKVGERAWNVYKALNVREGFTRHDDTYPKKWLGPVIETDGREKWLHNRYTKKILRSQDLDNMLDDYYDERGWDKEKGIPMETKLRELSLEDIAHDLYH